MDKLFDEMCESMWCEMNQSKSHIWNLITKIEEGIYQYLADYPNNSELSYIVDKNDHSIICKFHTQIIQTLRKMFPSSIFESCIFVNNDNIDWRIDMQIDRKFVDKKIIGQIKAQKQLTKIEMIKRINDCQKKMLELKEKYDKK